MELLYAILMAAGALFVGAVVTGLIAFSAGVKHRKKVDFPEPEGPITHSTSPLLICVVMPFNTCTSRKFFCKFSTFITLA